MAINSNAKLLSCEVAKDTSEETPTQIQSLTGVQLITTMQLQQSQGSLFEATCMQGYSTVTTLHMRHHVTRPQILASNRAQPQVSHVKMTKQHYMQHRATILLACCTLPAFKTSNRIYNSVKCLVIHSIPDNSIKIGQISQLKSSSMVSPLSMDSPGRLVIN